MLPPTHVLLILLASCVAAVSLPAVARDSLKIVATTSDLRSLAEAVGGARVAASHIVPPVVDPEDYQPHPNDLRRLRDADMVVRVGLDFDLWLDQALAQSGNKAIAKGGPGYVDASLAIALLDVRGGGLGGGDGHAHGTGNPHYWLDPMNAEIITGHVLETLARIDPAGARDYDARRVAFLKRLREKLPEWEAQLAAARRRPLIVQHNTWSYFERRFRLQVAGTIELRPGVPAGPAHLAALLQQMRERSVAVIVRQPHEPERSARFLADRTGARIAVLAGSVQSVPQASDFIALFDYNVAALAAAFGK
ncbi:MAG: zinc ABC transporter substrate-binding protein [Betaproteobacteria bacterium]|nr:zinc ABC transporter substrate-binding protein [Betaproteobacteria bacterium]